MLAGISASIGVVLITGVTLMGMTPTPVPFLALPFQWLAARYVARGVTRAFVNLLAAFSAFVGGAMTAGWIADVQEGGRVPYHLDVATGVLVGVAVLVTFERTTSRA